MGGEISIGSKVGQGTTVRLLFPPGRPGERPEVAPSEPAAAPRARVLVVDDEVMVGRSIERALGAFHEVVSVTSAREAERRLDAGERFEVILCDVMMPETTGIEFFERLRRSRPALAGRVVFITGGAFTKGAAEFLKGLENPCLEKPFDERRLLAAVRAVVDETQGKLSLAS